MVPSVDDVAFPALTVVINASACCRAIIIAKSSSSSPCDFCFLCCRWSFVVSAVGPPPPFCCSSNSSASTSTAGVFTFFLLRCLVFFGGDAGVGVATESIITFPIPSLSIERASLGAFASSLLRWASLADEEAASIELLYPILFIAASTPSSSLNLSASLSFDITADSGIDMRPSSKSCNPLSRDCTMRCSEAANNPLTVASLPTVSLAFGSLRFFNATIAKFGPTTCASVLSGKIPITSTSKHASHGSLLNGESMINTALSSDGLYSSFSSGTVIS